MRGDGLGGSGWDPFSPFFETRRQIYGRLARCPQGSPVASAPRGASLVRGPRGWCPVARCHRPRQGRGEVLVLRRRAPNGGQILPGRQLRFGSPARRGRHSGRDIRRRPPPRARGEPPGRERRGRASTSGRGALDALVGDLLAAQRLHLDREFVATLAEYYLGALTTDDDEKEDPRATQNSLKTLAQLLQEGGAHLAAREVDALISPRSSRRRPTKNRRRDLAAGEGRTRGRVEERAKRREGHREARVQRSRRLGQPRVPRGSVSPRAHVAVGEAIVAAFDAETGASLVPRRRSRDAREGPPTGGRGVRQALRGGDEVRARVRGGGGGERRLTWPDEVVGALVTHLRRSAYGLLRDQPRGRRRRRGPVEPGPGRVRSPAPEVGRRRGGGLAADRGYGSSDSDASDAEGEGIKRRFRRSIRRFEGSNKRRALRRRVGPRASRSMHARWPKLLPTSVTQLLARSPTATIVRCALNDPSPRVRAAATAATASLLEGPATKRYLAAAEVRTNPKTGAVVRAQLRVAVVDARGYRVRHARGVDARGTSRAGVVVRAGGVQGARRGTTRRALRASAARHDTQVDGSGHEEA